MVEPVHPIARAILSPQEQSRIEAAIAALESRSGAELAVVIARQSANYMVYSALWATCLALLAGWIAGFVHSGLSTAHLAILQGLVLLGAGGVLQLTPLGIMLVPASVKRLRAAAMAQLEFASIVHDRTRHKDGVLLFLSLAEHYIEIVADDAITATIPVERWQELIGRFTAKTKRRRIVDSLHDLITACGGILAAQFPSQPGQQNELPDRVPEI